MEKGKRITSIFKGTPRSIQRYYNNKGFDLDLKAVWFGFTAALGIWLLAAALGLLWLLVRGGGIYSYGVYIYLQGILGVFLGGLLAGTRVKRRGWLHGLWVGMLLALMGIIVRLEIIPQVFTWIIIGRQFLIWSLWGLAGGQVGYYLKESRLSNQARSELFTTKRRKYDKVRRG